MCFHGYISDLPQYEASKAYMPKEPDELNLQQAEVVIVLQEVDGEDAVQLLKTSCGSVSVKMHYNPWQKLWNWHILRMSTQLFFYYTHNADQFETFWFQKNSQTNHFIFFKEKIMELLKASG